MLITSFDASRAKSLITISMAVVLFALSLSLGFGTDNKDTLTATATYAAVARGFRQDERYWALTSGTSNSNRPVSDYLILSHIITVNQISTVLVSFGLLDF
jgi:hypothetical protein